MNKCALFFFGCSFSFSARLKSRSGTLHCILSCCDSQRSQFSRQIILNNASLNTKRILFPPPSTTILQTILEPSSPNLSPFRAREKKSKLPLSK